MRRFAILLVVSGLAGAAFAITGCSSAGQQDAARVRPITVTSHLATSFGPLDASFVSASQGWLLGVTTTGPARIELARTADGGRRWTPVNVPDAPWAGRPGTVPADAISAVTFANARDGWLYGPGLWATHDGGTSWHQIGTHGAEVDSVLAAGRRVLAVFSRCASRCPGSGPVRFEVYRSSAGRDSWHPAGGAHGPGSAQLAIAGSRAYVLGGGFRTAAATLLAGPVSGPGRWQQLRVPCPDLEPAAVAASAAGLVLACDQAPGAHPVRVQLYRSAGGGARWHHIAALYMQDGAGSLSLTASGMIALAGLYNGLMISRDDGKTWQRPRSVDRSVAVGGGTTVQTVMAGDRTGVFIAQRYGAWITRNAGRTWTALVLS